MARVISAKSPPRKSKQDHGGDKAPLTSIAGKNKSWRDVIKVHPAADLFPLLSPEELRTLADDIKKNGLTSQLIFWSSGLKFEDPVLLDRRNRLDAMEMAGLPIFDRGHDHLPSMKVPQKILGRSTDPYDYVISANIHRRHLTAADRLRLVDEVIKAKPDLSSRQIAKQTKVSTTTAVKRRKALEAKGDMSTVDTSTDTKGRRQPRTKSKREVTLAHIKGFGDLVMMDPPTSPNSTRSPPPAEPEIVASEPAATLGEAVPDRRTTYTVKNGMPLTSAVATGSRLLLDLYAQAIVKKADPAKVARNLGLKKEYILELCLWLSALVTAFGNEAAS
jgi:hypothetical protein